jgi:AcrR family transcriptional regulator
MRYTSDHSEETRARILEAAGRQFREHGYGGVGIDALARAAGVTSGAFYGHFRSKAAAFSVAATAGLTTLRHGVDRFRAEYASGWREAFSTFYLGRGHRRDLAGGCVLPSLTAAVGRADPATRAAFEKELLKVATALTRDVGDDRTEAWPLLALLAGGVMLARAVEDATLADEIAASVQAAVPRIYDGGQMPGEPQPTRT